jgi:putative ABC transport system permease protein
MRILAAIPSLTDLRHAFRSLRRARTAFGLATASLAIGIAMCVTMAGVLDTIVSPNIPIERPGDLYEVGWAASFRMAPRGTPRPNPDSALQRIATVKAIAKPPRGFVGGIISASGSTLIEGYGTGVDPTTLAMLGVRPMHGRLFVAPASGPIDGREAVLSEALWRQLYRGKRPFAPFTLHVDGHTLNVVGVAEPRLDRILGGKFWIQASDPLGRLNFESRSA